jgi:hypothetical protein
MNTIEDTLQYKLQQLSDKFHDLIMLICVTLRIDKIVSWLSKHLPKL